MKNTHCKSTLGRGYRNRYIPWASISVNTGAIHQYKEVAWDQAISTVY